MSKDTAVTRFRKKPVVVDANQWFKNGDHPLDYSRTHEGFENGELRLFGPEERKAKGWEGDIVRYYRTPLMDGQTVCKHCGDIMHNHGWIETLEGGHIVCPGDWIITGVKGEHYPCKPDIFAQTYEPEGEPAPAQDEREWTYCPECGGEEIRHQEGAHKQCANCHQEWFADIDYTDVVRRHLATRPAQAAPTPLQEATGAAAFKNFHRRLCERFGYTHDDEFWWRDLVSLEEHVAKQAAPQPELTAEELDALFIPGNGNKARRRAEALGVSLPTGIDKEGGSHD